ncbi:MAG: hypothetical protein U0638_01665 [Phycisphaerales bacterium]
MATATRVSGSVMGQSTRETLARLSNTEWEGQRWYMVDTHDPEEAMLASGLPAHGSEWSAAIPSLIVIKIGPPSLIVGRAGAPDRSGTMFVPVFYRTPGLAFFQPEVGDAWTEIASGQSSIVVQTGLVYAGGNWVPDTLLPAINNGQGAQKTVGVVEARVVAVYSEANYHSKKNTWAQYASEACFNSDAFTMPPVRDGSTPHSIAAEQAQYMGFEMETLGKGKVQATHRLGLFGSPYYRWFELDHDGMPIGTQFSARLWTSRPFAGIL